MLGEKRHAKEAKGLGNHDNTPEAVLRNKCSAIVFLPLAVQ
jgi:hypothetical protein